MPIRGEAFLFEGGKKRMADKHWGFAARDKYVENQKGRRVMEWRLADKNLINLGYGFENDGESESVNEMHGVDFINVVIPELIEKHKAAGLPGKVKILDLGSGMGFFNDQIRAHFGEEVEVYGTNLLKKRIERRKKSVVERIKNGSIPLTTEQRERLLGEISSDFNQNDAKWRSILEMHDFPEFDLIIDTCGEFFYAGHGFMPSDRYTNIVLRAAVDKLTPGGQLYVARTQDMSPDRAREIVEENKLPVSFSENKNGREKTAFIITKNINDAVEEVKRVA